MTHSVRKLLLLLGLIVVSSDTPQAQVVAPPLLQNFDQVRTELPEGWRAVSGDCRAIDGALMADSLTSDSYITFGELSLPNYEVQVIAVTVLDSATPPKPSKS